MKSPKPMSLISHAASVLLLLVSAASAAPIAFDVNCGGTTVGSVNIAALGDEIGGSFETSAGAGRLAAAAAACGEDHFNWYQVVTADSQAPRDRAGNQLNPPYVDVPPNGYDSTFDPTWADALPWYYDEYEPPVGTPNVQRDLLLSSQTGNSTLRFGDAPDGQDGLNLSFKTWLVSLNEDSSFHSFHGGFSWDFFITADGTDRGVANIALLVGAPLAAEYVDIIANFDTRIPVPASLYLLCVGLVAILASRKRAAGELPGA